jgi:uncharacterized membrane protein
MLGVANDPHTERISLVLGVAKDPHTEEYH